MSLVHSTVSEIIRACLFLLTMDVIHGFEINDHMPVDALGNTGQGIDVGDSVPRQGGNLRHSYFFRFYNESHQPRYPWSGFGQA